MATIEERADEYRRNHYDQYEEISEYELEDAYTVGATDQRKIDIDKACEWLRVNRWNYDPTSDYQFEDMLHKLKKTMEEDV